MKSQIFTSLCVLSAVGTLCLGTAARAESITFSGATPTASFGVFPFGPDFDATVALPRFDPALGTLGTVSLTLDAVGTTSGWGLYVFNPFLSQQSAFGVVGGSLRLLRPDNSELILLGHGSPITGLGVLPPESTTYVRIPVPDSTTTTLLTNPGDLSLFTGADTITLPVNGSAGPVVYPNPLQISSATSQTGFGRVTVTYEFTAIPEPSSIALLAVMTPGVALVLQRRLGRLRGVLPAQRTTQRTAISGILVY